MLFCFYVNLMIIIGKLKLSYINIYLYKYILYLKFYICDRNISKMFVNILS